MFDENTDFPLHFLPKQKSLAEQEAILALIAVQCFQVRLRGKEAWRNGIGYFGCQVLSSAP